MRNRNAGQEEAGNRANAAKSGPLESRQPRSSNVIRWEKVFIRKMEKAGILFTISYPGGGQAWLDADGVLPYMENRDQFYADDYGVSVETFLAWEDHMEHRQCQAKTSNGMRCRNLAHEYITDPKNFVPGVSGLCWVHSQKGNCLTISRT